MPAEPIPLTPLLDELRRALPEARRGRKEAGIHKLRVLTRRIDVWLRLSRIRVLRDDLRWLRALAGPVRDLDVLLANRGRDRSDPLRAARKEAQGHLRAGLATRRAEALVEALSVLSPLPAKRAHVGVGRLARRVIALPCDPSLPLDVHRRRRALRRLRYALELYGAPVDALVELQDALGVVSDMVLAHRWEGEPPVELADNADRAAPPTTPELAAALAAAEAAWELHLPTLRDFARWTSATYVAVPPSAPAEPGA